MARNYHEMAITLEGEVGSSLKKSTATAVQQLQQIDKQVKGLGSTQGKMEAFRTLRKELAESEKSLLAAQAHVKQLTRDGYAAAGATKEQCKAFGDAVREAQQLNGQVDRQNINVAQVRDALMSAGVNTQNFASEASRVKDELADALSNAENLRDTMSREQAARQERTGAQGRADAAQKNMLAVVAAAYTAYETIKKPIAAAQSLEDAMTEVSKYVNFDTPQQFQQMTTDISHLTREIRMTGPELASIVAFGGQLQIPRHELVGFARDAAKMGVAFGVAAEEAGQTMADWRSSMGLTQPQVLKLADQVNYLSNATGAKATAISEVIRRVGALGKVAGIASGNIAAMSTTVIKAGVDEERAATGIKNFMLGLTAGSAATRAQQKAFKALGFETTVLAKRMQKDAKGAILDVLSALQKMPKSEQLSMLDQLFGKESIGAIAPLLTSLPQLQANFLAVGDKAKYAGSMTAEFNTQMGASSAKQALAANASTELQAVIGKSLLPIWNDLMSGLQKGAIWLSNLITKYPILGEVLGIVAISLGVVTAALVVVTAATWLWNTACAMNPLTWIILAVVAAVAILVGGIYLLIKHWDQVKAAAVRVWNWIKGNWPLLLPIITGPFGMAVGFIIAHWGAIRAGIATFIRWLVTKAQAIYTAVTAPFKQAFQWIENKWNALKGIFSTVTNAAKNVAGKAWGKVTGLVSPAHNAVGNIINSPTLSWVGEQGRESIIPLDNHRNRAVSLWQQTGQALGVGGGTAGGGMTVTYAPSIHISGNASRGDVEASLRASYTEFRSMMAQWQEEQGRRVMA
jgi:TP901 family phage tail tape measure protein